MAVTPGIPSDGNGGDTRYSLSTHRDGNGGDTPRPLSTHWDGNGGDTPRPLSAHCDGNGGDSRPPLSPRHHLRAEGRGKLRGENTVAPLRPLVTFAQVGSALQTKWMLISINLNTCFVRYGLRFLKTATKRGWRVLLAHLGRARAPFQPHKASAT